MLIKIGKIELSDWQPFGDTHWIRCDPNADLRKPGQMNLDWDRYRINLSTTFSRFDSAYAEPYIWVPYFMHSLSFLQPLYESIFREFPINQIEEAKDYVDHFLIRANKLIAFL